MKIDDVMTQEVISISPEASVREAAQLMLQEHISGLPVINSAHVLVGIVTEGDLLRRVETGTEKRRPHWLEFVVGPNKLAGEYIRSHSRKVADVMTTDVAVANEDMPLDWAVAAMERRRIKRLPVVRAGRVVGIITRANLLHALVGYAPAGDLKASDAAIRDKIIAELDKQSWAPRQGHIVVHNGIVDLWGIITADPERDAIRVAAENTPGVKEVRDHLVWIEPYSGTLIDVGLAQPPLDTSAGESSRS